MCTQIHVPDEYAENADKVFDFSSLKKPTSRATAELEEKEANEGTQSLCAQWLWFIGFYTPSIIDDFCKSASSFKLTGFLMSGKPGIACLEGTEQQIDAYLKHVRTVVFACVDRNSRKMNVTLKELSADTFDQRRFSKFEHKVFANAHHKRSDMADMSALRVYLQEHNVPVELFKQVCMD